MLKLSFGGSPAIQPTGLPCVAPERDADTRTTLEARLGNSVHVRVLHACRHDAQAAGAQQNLGDVIGVAFGAEPDLTLSAEGDNGNRPVVIHGDRIVRMPPQVVPRSLVAVQEGDLELRGQLSFNSNLDARQNGVQALGKYSRTPAPAP